MRPGYASIQDDTIPGFSCAIIQRHYRCSNLMAGEVSKHQHLGLALRHKLRVRDPRISSEE